MERKSWIWGKMMYGKIQLFDSTPSPKAAALGKRNHSPDLHGGCGAGCALGVTAPAGPGAVGDTGKRGGTIPTGAEPVGQQPRKVPTPLFPSPGTVCATPYHCLNSKLSYLISLDFKTALEEKKAVGGDAAGAGGDGSADACPARAPLLAGTHPLQTPVKPVGPSDRTGPDPGPWDRGVDSPCLQHVSAPT